MTNDPHFRSPARGEDLDTKEPAIPEVAESSSPTVSGPLHISDAPRVDQALNSVLEHRNDPYIEPKETLSALREEADSLRYRASDDVRFRIRRNPWQAVGIAAFVGFLFGITR